MNDERDETYAGKTGIQQFRPLVTPATPVIPDERNPYRKEYTDQANKEKAK